MEHIQCTHCGKRYAVSDKVRQSEGQFTTCKSCKEKFLIVIHDGSNEPLVEAPDEISSAGWDPSLTMPSEDDEESEKGRPEEQSLDDDDGEEVLEALKSERQKKIRLYALIGVVICLILVGIYFLLAGDENKGQSVVQTSSKTEAKIEQSAKIQDENNSDCKTAAASQWLIDYKAMHGEYSGSEFVRLLKVNETQTAIVREHCKNANIIQDIIDAATAGEKPSWIATEINALQANQKH